MNRAWQAGLPRARLHCRRVRGLLRDAWAHELEDRAGD
jgi:hypothetical protein